MNPPRLYTMITARRTHNGGDVLRNTQCFAVAEGMKCITVGGIEHVFDDTTSGFLKHGDQQR